MTSDYEKTYCPKCGKAVNRNNDLQKEGKAHCWNCYYNLCHRCNDVDAKKGLYCAKCHDILSMEGSLPSLSKSRVDLLYRDALKLWGEHFQLNMVAEESAELIKAVLKLNRKTNGKVMEEVIDEIVDVEIMLEQLKIILEVKFKRDDIESLIRGRRAVKLLRLKDMVKNGN